MDMSQPPAAAKQASMKVGFVGFGAMAQNMAGRLRSAGFATVASDPAHHEAEVGGVALFKDAASLAREVDAVVVSVPADAALQAATLGPDGALHGARSGQLLIDTSTVSPEASKRLAEAAAERGVRFVEAPVSGSTPEAESGQLVVLAGGKADDIEAARPILDALACKVVHAGPASQGTAMKLAVNGVMALGTAAPAEGLRYGTAAGLDRTVLIETLQDLILVSEHHRRKLEMAKHNHYPSQFPTRLVAKDMGLLLADAGRRGVPLATMAAATQLFVLATNKHADEDYAAAIQAMEQLGSR